MKTAITNANKITPCDKSLSDNSSRRQFTRPNLPPVIGNRFEKPKMASELFLYHATNMGVTLPVYYCRWRASTGRKVGDAICRC